MSVRYLVAVAVVWVLSLVSVAVWAQGAQGSGTGSRRLEPSIQQSVMDAQVITGANFGFIPQSDSLNTPGKIAGRFVVKIGGKWVDAVPSVGITR